MRMPMPWRKRWACMKSYAATASGVVAALGQVLRNFGKGKARPARHGGPACESVDAYNAWRPEKSH
jgi:hypothetical protein